MTNMRRLFAFVLAGLVLTGCAGVDAMVRLFQGSATGTILFECGIFML